MRILIIVPAYNEEKNLDNLIEKLKKCNMDVLVVNDCSDDRTVEICEKFGVNYIDLPSNLGIGGAVQTGYKYAFKHNYDIAIQVDGDGQHNPDYIIKLVTPIIEQQADMIIGSRYLNKEGFQSTRLRRVGIKYFASLLNLLSKVKVTDPTSGFRACNKRVIAEFNRYYPIDYPEPESIMMLARKKYEIIEIPVVMEERKEGKSSINFKRSIYYMIKVTLAILLDRLRMDRDKGVYQNDI
ncbi:glycosyltransferase family 2 protein [Paenibacillus alvei]|uniref:Glycosyl transferase family 2 n=1 Tax=Paenibacillus alvei TaxID=44250 RepID=A0A383RH87_PAEAL|nr:glycosyltransferase family 2 protein [Paenibacillus alvei]SYX86455.1 Glycosyl transferase family 2 [Paenibacillus alvei]